MNIKQRVKQVLRKAFGITELQKQVARLDAACGQLQTVVKQAGGLLPPPEHLQIRVVGNYSPSFLESGETSLRDMNATLATVGKSFASFPKVLDFGCGCARVVRAVHFSLPSQKLYGTDIDAEAIEWCKNNYPQEFDVTPTRPPMTYADDFFDFVYSISIFTHLPEDMQFEWLAELGRITKPGGYLLLTVHGENHYHSIATESRHMIEDKGFVYQDNGLTSGLPDFYRTTYHSHDYIRSRWSEYFDILSIHKRAINNHQDAVLCRKR